MKRKAFSREERELMILEAMYNVANKKGNIGFTVYSIAKLLDMTPSPHLRKIMNGMVEKDILSAGVRKHREGVLKTVYWINNSDFYHREHESGRHEVLINGERVWL